MPFKYIFHIFNVKEGIYRTVSIVGSAFGFETEGPGLESRTDRLFPLKGGARRPQGARKVLAVSLRSSGCLTKCRARDVDARAHTGFLLTLIEFSDKCDRVDSVQLSRPTS